MNNFKAEQARFGLYHNKAIADRNIDELIGLARGLLADGHVNDTEISFLVKWLEAAEEVRSSPILCTLLGRIAEFRQDGVIDEEERQELTAALMELTGHGISQDNSFQPTTIPLTKPAPPVVFADQVFCFTGTFSYGPRAHCEQAVTVMGASVSRSVTRKIDFLVIGDYVTDAWQHSTYGRKIEEAVTLCQRGAGIHIIAESHWRGFL